MTQKSAVLKQILWPCYQSFTFTFLVFVQSSVRLYLSDVAILAIRFFLHKNKNPQDCEKIRDMKVTGTVSQFYSVTIDLLKKCA